MTRTYIVKGCSCCGSEPDAPCSCPQEGLDNVYKIKDFDATTFFDDAGVPGGCASSGPLWDGKLERDGGINSCLWRNYPDGVAGFWINGNPSARLYIDANILLEADTLNPGKCLWTFRVVDTCYNPRGIWTGVKRTGASPVGEYTQMGGVSSKHSTLTLEVSS